MKGTRWTGLTATVVVAAIFCIHKSSGKQALVRIPEHEAWALYGGDAEGEEGKTCYFALQCVDAFPLCSHWTSEFACEGKSQDTAFERVDCALE